MISRILHTIVIILTVFVSMNMISHAVQSQQQIQQEQDGYPYTNETNFTILYSPPLKLPGSELEMIYVLPVPNIDGNTSISMNNESIDINKTRGS